MQAGRNVKELGKENNLIELIKADGDFKAVHAKIDKILDAKNFIGRAPSQTVEFIETLHVRIVSPLPNRSSSERFFCAIFCQIQLIMLHIVLLL
mgnify:CR=1 FL=1